MAEGWDRALRSHWSRGQDAISHLKNTVSYYESAEKAVTKRARTTYLQELQSLIVSGELFEELDRADVVGVAIDSQQVVQVRNGVNFPNVVALEIEVLQMLELSQLVAQVANLRLLSVLQCQRRESIRCAI